jgi:hypothetical protein
MTERDVSCADYYQKKAQFVSTNVILPNDYTIHFGEDSCRRNHLATPTDLDD